MGRQINYYMVNEENIAIMAQKISDAGYVMIRNGEVVPTDGKSLYQATQPWGFITLFNSKFEETINLSEYTLEWHQMRTKESQKAVWRSRLYLNTQDFNQYEIATKNQLMADFRRLSSIVKKLSPMQTIEVNGEVIRNYMDDACIRFIQNGYRLRAW